MHEIEIIGTQSCIHHINNYAVKVQTTKLKNQGW